MGGNNKCAVKTSNCVNCISSIYVGDSMRRVFKERDLLILSEEDYINIKLGDVILFKKDQKAPNTVHRVIKKSAEAIITQGDNNPNPDCEPVLPSQLIRRVNFYVRNSKRHRVANGRLGLIVFKTNRLRRYSRNSIGCLLKPIVDSCPFSFFSFILGPLKLHKFKTGNILMINNKVVARIITGRWQVNSAFYRLFFNEKKLNKRFPITSDE